MSNVAFVGLGSCVELFSILGAETFVVGSKVEAENLVKSLCDQNFEIIFLTQNLFDVMSEFLNEMKLNFKTVISKMPC